MKPPASAPPAKPRGPPTVKGLTKLKRPGSVPARLRPPPPRERARILEIFERFAAAEPHPQTELRFSSPYTLLVAVALSAQATDKSVNKATQALFQQASTPQAMLDLGEAGLIDHIKTIGLFRTKAKNVLLAAQALLDRHGGEVPLERAALQALPGVGRKTASVVLNELGVEAAIAVDTHVFRTARRLRLSKGSTPDAVEQDLMRVTPEPFRTRAHHWLILHGRYVCLARRPLCPTCRIRDLCPSRAAFMDDSHGAPGDVPTPAP